MHDWTATNADHYPATIDGTAVDVHTDKCDACGITAHGITAHDGNPTTYPGVNPACVPQPTAHWFGLTIDGDAQQCYYCQAVTKAGSYAEGYCFGPRT